MVEMGLTRRQFIGCAAGAGAALALPWTRGTPVASAAVGGKLSKYVEPLPLPGAGLVVATPTAANRYAFTQRQLTRQLHPQLPPTPLWAYDDGSGLGGQAGSFGMVLVAQSGTPVSASFTNDLPPVFPSWLPIDTRLTYSNDRTTRVMTHLHGGFVAADSDGNPAVTPGGFVTGQTQTVYYTTSCRRCPRRCSGSMTTGWARPD
jgi:FtsP/CotA-like multicopper oxidase with cupredoxin domain